MPAPKGNNYGKEYWFNNSVVKPGLKSVRVSTRLSESEVEKIKQQLNPGETLASWLRDVARKEIAKIQVNKNQSLI